MAYKSDHLVERSNYFMLFFVISIGMLVSIFFKDNLPEQFYRDENFFRLFGDSSYLYSQSPFEDSYNFIVRTYSVLGVLQNGFLVALINFIIFNTVLVLVIKRRMAEFNPIRLGLALSLYEILVIFYGLQATKEIVSALLCLVIASNYGGRRSVVFKCSAIALVGLIFRKYYLLVLLFMALIGYMVKYLSLTKFKAYLKTSLIVMIILITLSIFFALPEDLLALVGLGAILNIKYARSQLLESANLTARTQVDPGNYSSSPVLNLFELLRQVFDFLIPTSLFSADLYGLFSLTLYSIILYFVISTFSKLFVMKQNKFNFISNFTLSFFLTCVLFEPDLGSFIRHIFPFLPLMITTSSFAVNRNIRDS